MKWRMRAGLDRNAIADVPYHRQSSFFEGKMGSGNNTQHLLALLKSNGRLIQPVSRLLFRWSWIRTEGLHHRYGISLPICSATWAAERPESIGRVALQAYWRHLCSQQGQEQLPLGHLTTELKNSFTQDSNRGEAGLGSIDEEEDRRKAISRNEFIR